MTVLLICVAYVANVFLNRWLNKIVVKLTGDIPASFLWFIPIVSTIVFIVRLIEATVDIKPTKFTNWFTGKHWE